VVTLEDGKKAKITIKGSKEAIASARKQIQAIAQDSADETVLEIRVPKALQPGLIGKGGSNSRLSLPLPAQTDSFAVRDMMARAGGPSDPRSQGFMMRLPRQGEEPSDVIVLRGRKTVVRSALRGVESS
jgi:hypothetical protein